MLRATLSRPDLDDPALPAAWDALATLRRSPFLRWSWAGCLAAVRFKDPWLLTVRDGGGTVGLALLGRTRSALGTTLHLNETGDSAADALFMEHNGIVSAPGREAEMLRTLFGVARSRVVLSGVGGAWLDGARQAGGVLTPLQTRPAPFVRLDAPDTHSRNTRAQLARSDRSYGVPLAVQRAATADEALAFLDAMLPWHLETWRTRKVTSGLAGAPVQAFLRAALHRGVACGDVDMLRVSAGARAVGYLLNLRAGGRVAAYASGFDYAGAGPHAKPGLSCHAAAIAQARRDGALEYDFLAGDARYKRSLANDTRALHWFTWQPPLSRFAAAASIRRILQHKLHKPKSILPEPPNTS